MSSFMTTGRPHDTAPEALSIRRSDHRALTSWGGSGRSAAGSCPKRLMNALNQLTAGL